MGHDGKKRDGKRRFRFATEMDVETILDLIKELAAYEHLSHEVTADAETLRQSLFGSRKTAEVLLAEYEGIAVGYALFFHNFSTFKGKPGLYLEDLFVKEAYRGKGIGEGLFRQVARVARERGCARMEWAVLNWNDPAFRFYHRFGATPLKEWTIFRLAEKALGQVSSSSVAGEELTSNREADTPAARDVPIFKKDDA